jgi:hypothetical protein
VAAGFAAWGLTAAADLAVSIAALAFSLVAYLVVATSVRVRAPRPRAGQDRHVAEDPSFRPRRPWRFAARMVLAGPLSLVFATAACVAIATRTPAAEVDGLILGGLIAPVGFAGAMAWSLIDQRLTRVAAGLAASSLLLSGLAIWPS